MHSQMSCANKEQRGEEIATVSATVHDENGDCMTPSTCSSSLPSPSSSNDISLGVNMLPSIVIPESPVRVPSDFSRNEPGLTDDTSYSPSVVVLEALAKFQTCLLVLSNGVMKLHESLMLSLPPSLIEQVEEEEQSISTISSPNMDESSIVRPIVRRLSHSRISIENNNTKGVTSQEGMMPETAINVSNSSISTSISTDSSNVTIVPSGNNSGNSLKSPKKCSLVPVRFLRYIGILLALFASLCMSLVTLVVKFMEGYHPVSKVIWRMQGVLAPSILLVAYYKYFQKKKLIEVEPQSKEEESRASSSQCWKWKLFILLVIRGMIGCAADVFQYYSLKYLPLADSTVISFSTPIFVCIMAHFVLGEKCGLVPIFTALLTLCGVIVISKPPVLTGEEEMSSTVLLGNILALLCMICNTITTVVMRYLYNVHFSLTMLALGICGTVEGYLVSLFTGPIELPNCNTQDWYLAALIAGVFFVGQLSYTIALQLEEATVVSLIRTCDVLFAFIWQVNFLHQEANMLSYIGAAIVTMGVCATALRKWLSELPDHSPIKNRFYFVLR